MAFRGPAMMCGREAMVPRGPAPSPNARRRNQPTIPTTVLVPRAGKTPQCPYELGDAGRRWWKWAWGLPQASQWGDGALYFVARRAQLEDELAVREFGEDRVALEDLLMPADEDALKAVQFALDTLKKAATGQVSLMKEMRELDNRLGLNPKAMLDLRWSVGEPEGVKSEPGPALAVVKPLKMDKAPA